MDKARQMLCFQQDRKIKNLFIRFLEILEGLKSDHDQMVSKLTAELPAEYHNTIKLVNHLNEDKFRLLRKQILDSGGSTIRELEEYSEVFEIDFNGNWKG